MTKRDKNLLMFLVLFLILVGFSVLIFLPEVGSLSEVNAGITEATIQKEEIMQKSAKVSDLEETLEDKEAQFASLTKHFHPLMQSQEIDDLLTGKALGKGLSIRSLNIGQVEPLETLEAYIGAVTIEEAQAEEEQVEEVQEEADTTLEELADEESGNSDGASEGGNEEEVFNSVIHQSKISITVEGNTRGVQNLIDELFNDPSILVTGWQRTNNGAEEGQEITMINLTIFMCSVE